MVPRLETLPGNSLFRVQCLDDPFQLRRAKGRFSALRVCDYMTTKRKPMHHAHMRDKHRKPMLVCGKCDERSEVWHCHSCVCKAKCGYEWGGWLPRRVEKSCFVFLYNTVLPPLPPEPGGCRLGGGFRLRPRESAAADRGDSVRGEAGRGGAGRGEAACWRAGSSSARACAAADTSSASASEPDSSELDNEDGDAPSPSLRRSRLRSARLTTGAGRVRPQKPQRIKISNRPRLFTVDW